MKQESRKHELCGGKYRVTHENGALTVLRHGEEWSFGNSILSGDSLSLAMIQRIEALEDRTIEVAKILSTKTEDAEVTIETALNVIYTRLKA